MAPERTVKFSKEELQIMTHKIEEFAEILYDENIHKSTVMEYWKRVADAVKACKGVDRTVQQIQKKAGKIRSAAKQKGASLKKSLGKTGGGPSEHEELDEYESVMLNTIPKVSYSGIDTGIDTSEGTLSKSVAAITEAPSILPLPSTCQPMPMSSSNGFSMMPSSVGYEPLNIQNIQDTTHAVTPPPSTPFSSNAISSDTNPFNRKRHFHQTSTRAKVPRSGHSPSITTLMQEQLQMLREHHACFLRMEKLMSDRNEIERNKLSIESEKLRLLKENISSFPSFVAFS